MYEHNNATITYIEEILKGKRLNTGKFDGGLPITHIGSLIVISSFGLFTFIFKYLLTDAFGNLENWFATISYYMPMTILGVIALWYVIHYIANLLKITQFLNKNAIRKLNEELLSLKLMDTKRQEYAHADILEVSHVRHEIYGVEIVQLKVQLGDEALTFFAQPSLRLRNESLVGCRLFGFEADNCYIHGYSITSIV